MIEQPGEEYKAAHARALLRMEKGFHMGGQIRFTREELHDRAAACEEMVKSVSTNEDVENGTSTLQSGFPNDAY